MKTLLVLTRLVKEYEPQRFKEVGESLGYKVTIAKYGQVALGVDGGQAFCEHKGEKISEFDLVVMRSASKKGSSMVGIKTAILSGLDPEKVINGRSFSKYPLLGKVEQGLMMAAHGLPVPDLVTFGSKLGFEEFAEDPRFPLPWMVKGRFGSHGRTVKLVNDKEQFLRVSEQYKEGEVLLQPVIKAKQWYRTIVVKGEYLGEMLHRQKSKYGAVEGPLIKFGGEKMKKLQDISIAAANLFDCDYAGIDILWDEDKQDFVILEVNRTAQFKYFERRTGMNVVERVLR